MMKMLKTTSGRIVAVNAANVIYIEDMDNELTRIRFTNGEELVVVKKFADVLKILASE